MIAPLLVTSAYSFLYGTAQPEALAARAAQLGYAALAITDRNGVYGLPAFIEACGREKIRPVLGTELVYEGGRALLLAKDRQGFALISTILTDRAEGRFDPRASLGADHTGLVVITDDMVLLEDLAGKADVYSLLSPFNRSRWRELCRNAVPPVATGETRFLEAEDREVQRVLCAIDRKTTVDSIHDDALGDPGATLPSPSAFADTYRDIPEALRANKAVVEAAAYCRLFDGFLFPPYTECGANASDSGAILRAQVLEGATRRYGAITQEVLARVDYELGIIEKKGFSSYFLTVRDIANRASRTCGRGSAAASIVSYCLGITDVDPLRHHLYFERFLNPGRKDPPDIDVDFAWDERDDLLASVIQHYGEAHAARVSNHVCFQRSAALRETARAYGLPEGEISAIERQKATDPTHITNDESWAQVERIAPRLVGLPRNLGVHSGGLIIVPDRISDHVPIERSGSGIRVTAWEKDGVESAGLVKIDLLGNRSLAVVRDTLANLTENGIPLDEDQWHPIDDPATIAMLARGDTMGVFYVESPAMRILQQKTRRGDFEHLVIHSSIIRPAANSYINEYVERLRGKTWKPIHPLLAGLFDESFGIMCYQEDVSKAAIALSGFSAEDADGIRKILAKKDADTKLQRYWPAFLAGARARGVDDSTIEAVWNMMRSFSGYSFVKAHSASYAMLSFKSAYLRCHYPAEFMAAVISNRGGFYSTLAYVSECRRMGLTVLPPDINRSELRCRGEGSTLRFGLELISSLGVKTARSIVDERHRHGAYRSIEDVAERVPMDRTDAEALAGSGALDGLSPALPRSKKLMRLFILSARASNNTTEPELFDGLGENHGSVNSAPLGSNVSLSHPMESERKILEAQMKYLGTTLSVHPLTLWPEALRRPRVLGKNLPFLVGKRVELIGWPITAKSVLTSSEQPMEFVSFEDETALYETVLFPETYRRFHHLLYDERPLLLQGIVECDHGAITLTVERISKDI
jgi:error-prone DNA polymerase